MGGEPLISVVIPTYNHAHFLREALQSVCDQTFTDWEAVVINNYSEDDTIAVVESFADARIRLENFRNNGIIAAARNRGIALARGRYLAFLDSDDVWYTNKLARCLECFKDGVGLVAHGLRRTGEEKKDLFCGPAECATFDALLDGYNCITPSATIVRRDIALSVGCFSEDEAFITAEDYHFSLKLAQAGVKMHFIREILGEYRVHTGNMSASSLRQMNAGLRVVREFLSGGGQNSLNIRLRIRRRYCFAYYSVGRAAQRRGNFIQSWPLLFRAVAYNPLFVRAYVAMIYCLFGTLRSWIR